MNGWDCPMDLVVDERIEVYDQGSGIASHGKFVGLSEYVDGNIRVILDAYPNSSFTVDPKFTQWRRTKPKEVYGARCTGKYCGEFFEHALATPDFKCYSCRNR